MWLTRCLVILNTIYTTSNNNHLVFLFLTSMVAETLDTPLIGANLLSYAFNVFLVQSF